MSLWKSEISEKKISESKDTLKLRCSKCEFPAVKGCRNCGLYGLLYCSACLSDHSTHPRFSTHKPCTIIELNTYNKAQKEWADKYRKRQKQKVLEESEKRDIIKKKQLQLSRTQHRRRVHTSEISHHFKNSTHSTSKIVIFKFASGSRYEGEILDKALSGGQNTPNGYGELFASETSHPPGHLQYEGMWRQGLRWGKGTRFWPDGGRWEGSYKQDQMHGSGRYYKFTKGDPVPIVDWWYYRYNRRVATWQDLVCGTRISVVGRKGLPPRCATLVARDSTKHHHRVKYDNGVYAAWHDLGSLNFTVIHDQPLVDMPENMKMIPHKKNTPLREISRIDRFNDIISSLGSKSLLRSNIVKDIAQRKSQIQNALKMIKKVGARKQKKLRESIDMHNTAIHKLQKSLNKLLKDVSMSYGITDTCLRHPSISSEWPLNTDNAQWGHLREAPFMQSNNLSAPSKSSFIFKSRRSIEEDLRLAELMSPNSGKNSRPETAQEKLVKHHQARMSNIAKLSERKLRANTSHKRRMQMKSLEERCRKSSKRNLPNLTPLTLKLLKRADPATGGVIRDALRKIGDPRLEYFENDDRKKVHCDDNCQDLYDGEDQYLDGEDAHDYGEDEYDELSDGEDTYDDGEDKYDDGEDDAHDSGIIKKNSLSNQVNDYDHNMKNNIEKSKVTNDIQISRDSFTVQKPVNKGQEEVKAPKWITKNKATTNPILGNNKVKMFFPNNDSTPKMSEALVSGANNNVEKVILSKSDKTTTNPRKSLIEASNSKSDKTTTNPSKSLIEASNSTDARKISELIIHNKNMDNKNPVRVDNKIRKSSTFGSGIRTLHYYKSKWRLQPHFGLKTPLLKLPNKAHTLVKDILNVTSTRIAVMAGGGATKNQKNVVGSSIYGKQTKDRVKCSSLVDGDAFRSFRHLRRFHSRRIRGLKNALDVANEIKVDVEYKEENDTEEISFEGEKNTAKQKIKYQDDGTEISCQNITVSTPRKRIVQTIRDAFEKW